MFRLCRARKQRAKRSKMFRFDNWCWNLTVFVAPDGVVAQLVERLNGIQEVRGSNPLGSTIRPGQKISIVP
jgi:hypothetical protein